MIDSQGIIEVAKGVQEVAKTTRTALEAARETGRFIAPFLDGPLTQMALLLEDRLKYARTTRLIRLRKRLEEEVQTLSPDGRRSLEVKFAVAALEEGSLEEEDDLQDIWARLIANAMDAEAAIEPRRSHISILRDMSRLDALVFEAVYSVPDGDTAIVTHKLPEKAYRADKQQAKDDVPEPNETLKVSLANLERLGVIAFGSSWGGAEIFRYANTTTAGHDLFQAIKRRKNP